jgi:SAM-dependent methyltransferase
MEPHHAQFDGSIPDNYDSGLGPNMFTEFADDLASRVAAANPRCVLELASGTGIVTRLIRDAIHDDCELVASDLSDPMLEIARRKFGAHERVRFELADAGALSFADQSFDLVACQFGIMFFPDKDAAYREAFRVLTPGGRYVFNVWSSFDHNPFSRIAHETTSAFFDGEPPGFYRVPFSYHDAEVIQAGLESAGYCDVASETRSFDKVVADYDRFAHGLVFGNPLAAEIADRGRVDPDTVKAAIASALRAEFGEEPSAMPLRGVVWSASRPTTPG